jgi:hypothetical protein
MMAQRALPPAHFFLLLPYEETVVKRIWENMGLVGTDRFYGNHAGSHLFLPALFPAAGTGFCPLA